MKKIYVLTRRMAGDVVVHGVYTSMYKLKRARVLHNERYEKLDSYFNWQIDVREIV